MPSPVLSSALSRWPRERRAFGAALRAGDPLAWAGLGGAVVLALYPLYWVGFTVVPLLGGSAGHAADFEVYWDAGRRVLQDPMRLYDAKDFLYPPPTGAPFALVARLPLAVGYLGFAAANVALLAACVRAGERLHPAAPTGWARAALWATALGSAPALQTVKFGQVGALVLLASLLFLAWLPARPGRAGAVLALGAWLKLYPAALGVFALRRASWRAIAVGGGVALAVPLVLWPWFPPELYVEYVRERLPEVTGQTVATALNVGLPATIERLRLPADVLVQYTPMPMSPAADGAGKAALLVGIGGAVVAWLRGAPLALAGVAALAAVPVASSFAWEYTVLLAMPAALACLLVARRGGAPVRALAALAALTLFLQKPPEFVLRAAIERVPEPLLDLFVARVLLALATLATCAWWVLHAERRALERT